MKARINVLVLAALAAACSDNNLTGSVPSGVAGQYRANASVGSFMFSDNGETWNLAEEGGLIDLRLYEDGTTGGRIFVPAESETAQDYEADLLGIWAVRNDTVFVNQTFATIISSMGLAIDGNQLHGEGQYDNASVSVTLVR